MKKVLFLSIACMGFVSFFSSCKKTNSIDTGSGDSIFVSLSSPTVELNNFDYVKISVTDKAGNDITSSCNLLLNNNTTISSKYVPTMTGTFNINATRGTSPSSVQQLTVVTKSASPFTQKILLEDVTGAWCGYCPRAAHLIETYKSTHPNCISIAVHGGGPDPMNFQYYSSFNTKFNVDGYPTVVFNRKMQTQSPISYGWNEDEADLDLALSKWAPLGLAINSSVSGNNITGSVKVKFNVTTEKSMKLVIALVENDLISSQTNYYSPQYGVTPYLYGGISPVTNFVNNGVLRKTSTDLFGDVIPVSFEFKDNVYELPFTFPLSGVVSGGTPYTVISNNSAIVAFVVDGTSMGITNKGIYNVQYAAVGSTKDFD